jgi:hypothetical protein
MRRPKVTREGEAQPTPLDLGLALLKEAATPEALAIALDALPSAEGPHLRQAFVDKYASYAAHFGRSDPGCFQRVLLLKAWRQRATREDIPVLESALWTFEFLPPGPKEVAGNLRGAALVNLDELDDRLAAFHAARLLRDGYTSPMSGEPAITAARVLAAQKQALPLYEYALAPRGQAEVLAECLRGLSELPLSVLVRLLEEYREVTDEIVLLGLFDLVLAHPERPALTGFVYDFLRTTTLIDVYRVVVTSIVAQRDETFTAVLRQHAQSQPPPDKAAILRDALQLTEPLRRR